MLAQREGGWRLQMAPKAKGQESQALDFDLDEVREARLVPVLDFKGSQVWQGRSRRAEADGGCARRRVSEV